METGGVANIMTHPRDPDCTHWRGRNVEKVGPKGRHHSSQTCTGLSFRCPHFASLSNFSDKSRFETSRFEHTRPAAHTAAGPMGHTGKVPHSKFTSHRTRFLSRCVCVLCRRSSALVLTTGREIHLSDLFFAPATLRASFSCSTRQNTEPAALSRNRSHDVNEHTHTPLNPRPTLIK